MTIISVKVCNDCEMTNSRQSQDPKTVMTTHNLKQQMRAEQAVTAGMGDDGLKVGVPPKPRPMSRPDNHLYMFLSLCVANVDEYMKRSVTAQPHLCSASLADGPSSARSLHQDLQS